MQWFIAFDGRSQGPFAAAEVLARIRGGQLPPGAVYWRNGLAGWIGPQEALPELTGSVAQPPALPALPVAATASSSRSAAKGLTDHIADLARVERLEGFSLGELLSATFQKQDPDAIERHFSTGLPETTPGLAQIETGWPKPWMFVRLLLLSVLLFGGAVFLAKTFGNPLLIPTIIVLGSLAAPMATVVFFYELNSPRNVSLYQVIRMLMIGGLVSIGFSLLLFELTAGLSWVGPPLAGLVEEIGKVVTVFVIARGLDARRYPYILNGLLFGACVGAGFAIFETMGYALSYLVETNGDFGAMMQIIIARGLLAPFAHVVWTALAAGALWRVKLDQPLRTDMLFHPRVLRMLAVVMPLHALWNLGLIDLPYFAKHLALGVIAWVIAFSLLQTGLKQIKAAQMAEAEGQAQLSGATAVFSRAGLIGALQKKP
ncbi:MAG: PrsW family intramembrane metalloprotease [Xanthomonadales bacterium]|nr:PrsW family intramembrane metalloprotease [Xanthomonadales bacterium]